MDQFFNIPQTFQWAAGMRRVLHTNFLVVFSGAMSEKSETIMECCLHVERTCSAALVGNQSRIKTTEYQSLLVQACICSDNSPLGKKYSPTHKLVTKLFLSLVLRAISFNYLHSKTDLDCIVSTLIEFFLLSKLVHLFLDSNMVENNIFDIFSKIKRISIFNLSKK